VNGDFEHELFNFPVIASRYTYIKTMSGYVSWRTAGFFKNNEKKMEHFNHWIVTGRITYYGVNIGALLNFGLY
jgi:uncharacterized protein YutD